MRLFSFHTNRPTPSTPTFLRAAARRPLWPELWLCAWPRVLIDLPDLCCDSLPRALPFSVQEVVLDHLCIKQEKRESRETLEPRPRTVRVTRRTRRAILRRVR